MTPQTLVLGLAFLISSVCAAQEPRLVNAKLESRSAAAGLDQEFQSLVQAQAQPIWIGYAVPAIPGNHDMCCWEGRYENWRSRCSLESEHATYGGQDVGSKRVALEAPESMMVMFRAAGRRITKIRTFSESCELDAGGLTVFWLTDAKPAESAALLSSFVRVDDENKEGERLSGGALAAIAMTNDSVADHALDQLAASGPSEHLREQAAFWLGSARGRHGFETLARLGREDSDEQFRKHVTFALSVSNVPEAVAAMISMARNDPAASVRGQALFWLAQKAGKKAAEAINDAIENDPETDVKKRAVFALTQLPHDEGVPMLINVARTNRNREVRKQAMFWLGQSNDPRAAAFIEEVLLR